MSSQSKKINQQTIVIASLVSNINLVTSRRAAAGDVRDPLASRHKGDFQDFFGEFKPSAGNATVVTADRNKADRVGPIAQAGLRRIGKRTDLSGNNSKLRV